VDWRFDKVFAAETTVSPGKVFRDQILHFITVSRNLCFRRKLDLIRSKKIKRKLISQALTPIRKVMSARNQGRGFTCS